MVIATGIEVQQGRRQILRGLDFHAEPGAVTAIVGPSGAGKSTLLKAMTGDVSYDGQVTLNGADIAGQSPGDLARQRAVLPQATPLAFPFTVAEVVRLGVRDTARPALVVAQALHRVGLAGFEPAFYQELSGGEQQRVQLARVLAQVWQPLVDDRPRWLLLDEPVSSLDIGHQLRVMTILRDFAAAGGGVVMVMHDLNLTAMSADAVALMRDGQMLAQGRPEEVLTDALLSHAYGCALAVNRVPPSGVFVLPQSAGAA